MEEVRSLGQALGCAAHLFRERADARMANCGVTPLQAHVILHLNFCGGSLSQMELGRHLRVKPSTVNGILDRMEEKGIIRRTADKNDQRQKRVSATEKGREMKELVRNAFQDAEAAMARGLRPDEAETLRSLLGRVIENLEEDRTPC